MRLDVRKIAEPIMNELHNDVKEAINLIVRDGDDAVYIEKIDTKQKVRLYTAIGRKVHFMQEHVLVLYYPFTGCRHKGISRIGRT